MPNRHRRFLSLHRFIFLAVVCGGIGLTAAARGQVPPAPAPPATGGDDQSSHDDKATPPGVSIADSPGAQEKLDKAREKENQKQWKTAAEYYQEALTKYSARVVPVKRNPESGIYHYAGIAMVIQERMAKWPEEGLKIYRNQYGQTAADLLNTASRGDLATLRTVFWNYFATDAGKTAGIRLMDTYMESGEFQAAAWTGDRLLTLHPGLSADRAMVLYRTAIAHYWAGDATDSHRLLADLKQSDPTAVGSIAGKDVLLLDSLTALLTAPAIQPTTRSWDADTYPSFGGIGERGDISSSTAKPGASLNSIPLTPPDANGMMGGNRKQYTDMDRSSLSSGAAMGIMPTADGGALFFQDGRCVYAVDADSGSPLPGWLNTYTGEHAGRYRLNVPGRARNELLTVTVTPSSVLAIMGQPDHTPLTNQNFNGQFMLQNPQTSTVKLVCLDRETGRELWTRIPADLPDSIAALHTADYCGTPLLLPASVAGHGPGDPEDSVLVVARGGTQNQFDDCYVVCLSLKSGQYRWSTYIGSATRSFEMDGSTTIQPSQMSLADGRVFVMTNLGTVAALDPSDGRVIWLNSYTREASDNPDVMMMMRGGGRRFAQMQGNVATTVKPWAHNPVFVSDGFVYVLPNDAKNLFIYDEGTGNEQRRIPMSQCDDADVVLGVRDGIVCLTSKEGAYAIDWRQFSPDRGSKFIVWQSNPVGSFDADAPMDKDHSPEVSSVTGRGFMTADSVFIPTKFRLVQKSWKLGRTIQFYPSRGNFTGSQGPGNLLVTAHNVIVAAQEHVDVYTDLMMVRQRFETAMAEAPTDPAPRMAYAEALFAGGQTKDALNRVDEAISLIGGMNAMRSGTDRTMIYNRILDFARRIETSVSRSDASPDSVALGNEFFDRAGAAAETPVQMATYRLERAKFDHKCVDFAGEVRLCQEVLSDDAMRAAVLDNDVSAAASAESAIDAANSLDHSVYSNIEQQAEDALKTSHESGDPLQLLKVAAVYPNSKAAKLARQEAVQRFEAANQPDKAIEVLRRIYTGATDQPSRADLLLSIANDYLAIPGDVGPALDRLCRASLLMPSQKISQKLRLPDGTTLSDVNYADAIAAVRKIQSDQETAALPDFHLPAPKGRANSPFVPGEPPVIGNVAAVVHPLRDFNRNDQILTWSLNGLSIYPAGQTTPMATIPVIDKFPLAAAWVHDSWIVWTSTTAYRISSDGRVVWTFTTIGLPTIPVSTGGDAIVNEAGDGAADDNANQVNQIVQNGRVIRVVGPNGAINIQRLQRMNAGGAAAAPVVVLQRPGAEEIIAVQPGGPAGNQLLISTSSGRILSLEGRSGQILWQTRPADHGVNQLLANAHFTVIRLDDPAGSQLAVFDTVTGHVIGRRLYGQENTARQLVNVALSEDAMLAVTLSNQVMVKDLYDPWKPAFTELTAKTNVDAAPFDGLNLPDQLIIKGGRLVCLYGGAGYVRSYDLSRTAEPSMPLNTSANTAAVTLRMIGSRLFIQTASGMHQYSLDDPTSYPAGGAHPRDVYDLGDNALTGSTFPPKVRNIFVGKDYAVVISDSVDRGPLGSPNTALATLRRALIPGTMRESGNIDWFFFVQRPPHAIDWPGVTDWLCSDGAIYYLTKDGNLHILRGARP